MKNASRIDAGLKAAATRAARKAAGLPPVYPRSARKPARASGFSAKWEMPDAAELARRAEQARQDEARRLEAEAERARWKAEQDRIEREEREQARRLAEEAEARRAAQRAADAKRAAAAVADQARRAAAAGFKPNFSQPWTPSQAASGGQDAPPPPPKAQAPAPKKSVLFTGPDAREMALEALLKLEGALGEFVAESGKAMAPEAEAKFKTFLKVKALALNAGTPAEGRTALRTALKMMTELVAVVL